jgi:hypothetical protein
VFTIFLIIFLGSYVIVAATGGVGPCGPSLLGLPFLVVGLPAGFVGMVIGLILSLVKTFKHFKSLQARKSDAQF